MTFGIEMPDPTDEVLDVELDGSGIINDEEETMPAEIDPVIAKVLDTGFAAAA